MSTRIASTVEQLRHCNELLHGLLSELEDQLAEREDAEPGIVCAALDQVLENLDEQCLLEEEGEYLAHVLDQYPSWHPQVRHLQQEQRLLERQLREIRDRAAQEGRAGVIGRHCCRQIRDWIAAYRAHEHRECSLLQEAYLLEVGQGE